MKILWSWLKQYTSTKLSPQEVAKALTFSGTETHLEEAYPWAKTFEVALIEKAEMHPNASRLQVCQVKTGSGENLTVVCGAPNARGGLKTILARPGAFLPGQTTPLQSSTLRGVESQGMLCSAEELWSRDLFSGENGGIVELDEHIPLGTPLVQLMNALTNPIEQPKHDSSTPEEEDTIDILLNMEVTPNRGDLFHHLGVAREIYALEHHRQHPWKKADMPVLKTTSLIPPGRHPTPYEPKDINLDSLRGKSIEKDLQVNLEIPGVFFTLTALELPYPEPKTLDILKRRLWAVGVKPHFPLVDLTNLLAFGSGQPMHVFDREALRGSLTLRLSREGEEFLALNEKSYILPEGLAVLADDEGLLSLPGVMGGYRGRCQPETRHVLLEAAYFPPSLIAKAGRATGINSASQMRFERGIDGQNLLPHVGVAVTWAQEVLGAQFKGFAQWGEEPKAPKPIHFSFSRFQNLTQASTSPGEAAQRIWSLGAEIKAFTKETQDAPEKPNLSTLPDEWIISPPSWRQDWHTQADTTEEILRLQGYTDIPSLPLPAQGICLKDQRWTGKALDPIDFSWFWKARRFLSAQGGFEAVTWSFCSLEHAQDFFEGPLETLQQQALANPISQDMSHMRPHLFCTLLNLVEDHKRKQIPWEPFFEIGPRFEGRLAHQQKQDIALILPREASYDWQKGTQNRSWPDVKAWAYGLCEVLDIALQECTPDETAKTPSPWRIPSWYHPYQSLIFTQTRENGEKEVVGYAGRLHPRLLIKRLGSDQKLWGIELHMNALKPQQKSTHYVSSFLQPLRKDLSFFLPKDLKIGSFLHALSSTPLKALKDIQLIDVFQGTGDQAKSVTLSACFQPQDESFSSEEIHELLVALASKGEAMGATLRGSLNEKTLS